MRPTPVRDGAEPGCRFTLANERTLLSWVRTASSPIAAAVAVVGTLVLVAALLGSAPS